ncbi:hypothetical protein, partial [Streptomyces xiaopingdaonensis]|uniref:hypothetical protein n=1 Tax=Streptomyces xiaopingdaonensis TaxID=1565415 RepID=UPI001ED8CFE7
ELRPFCVRLARTVVRTKTRMGLSLDAIQRRCTRIRSAMHEQLPKALWSRSKVRHVRRRFEW